MRLLLALAVFALARCGEKEPDDTGEPGDTGTPSTGASETDSPTDTDHTPGDSPGETAEPPDSPTDTGDTGEREPIPADELQYGDLIVTEFMAEPCTSQGYWVEIRNMLDRDVDLYGLHVGHDVFIGARLTIPAAGTFTIAKNDSWTANFGVNPDYEESDFDLWDQGDVLGLSVGDTVIDALAFDATWHAGAYPGRALSLDPASLDATTNDDPAAWCHASNEMRATSSCTAYGTPGDDNEGCANGLGDLDGDGWDVDNDCNDEEPAVNPDAAEDCSDGRDDDCDALVDCEDGDCAGVGTCGEVTCDDGLDDDADGLIDCEDDDCWGGECHPEGVRVQVLGGRFALREDGERQAGVGPYYWTTSNYDCHAWGNHTADTTMVVSGVHGVLQVLPSNASWDTTSARTSCTWSVKSMQRWQQYSMVRTHYRLWTKWSASATRTGFHLQSGCRAQGSWFLPTDLLRLDDVVYGDYTPIGGSGAYVYSPWYALQRTSGSSWRSSGASSNICGDASWTTWTSTQAGSIGSSLSAILVEP